MALESCIELSPATKDCRATPDSERLLPKTQRASTDAADTDAEIASRSMRRASAQLPRKLTKRPCR